MDKLRAPINESLSVPPCYVAAIVFLQVGCNNLMFPTGKLIASQIGEQMNEGLIADITDLNFDWWSLWTQRSNSR